MKKIRSLEVLRAVSALLVILFHIQTVFGLQGGRAPLASVFYGAHRGVDLFFVLSGFIIAYVHGDDLGRPDRLKTYLFNRVARLYPAVWIMTALAFLVYMAGFGGPDKASKLVASSVVASALLLPQQGVPLVNVTWTLTYEVFFYALFAVLIVNVRIGLFLLLAWQAAVLAFAVMEVDIGLAGYYLRTICLDFGVGLACAWWVRRMTPGASRPAIWFPLLVAGMASFIYGMDIDGRSDAAGVLCALGAGLVIVSLVRLEETGHLRVPSFLVAIGGASYAIYLVHYAVIQLLSAVLRRMGVPITDLLCVAYVVVGISAGLAFDRWIDKPLQSRLRRLKSLYLEPPKTVGAKV